MPAVINEDDRRTLAVLSFLFLRMGLAKEANRIYEAIVELSQPGSADRRFAEAGLAALAVEAGDGKAALAHINAALASGRLATNDSALHLIKAQALWLQDRREEAAAARDEYLNLTAGAES